MSVAAGFRAFLVDGMTSRCVLGQSASGASLPSAPGHVHQKSGDLQRTVVTRAKARVQQKSPVDLEMRGLSSPESLEHSRRSLEGSYAQEAYKSSSETQDRVWEWPSDTSGLWISDTDSPVEEQSSTQVFRHDFGSTAVLATEEARGSSPHSRITSTSDLNLLEDASGACSARHGAHKHAGPVRRTCSHPHGRIKVAMDEDMGQRIPEASAWKVIEQWRRVVDCCSAASQTSTQGDYAMDVQTLNVQNLPLSQRKELQRKSGLDWKSILRLQRLKGDAEMNLLHCHRGLLTTIVRKLQSDPSFFGQNEADIQVEGMGQLRACIWSFDQGKGASFSTYVWSQLPIRMRQALEGKDRAVHVPVRELDKRKRVHAALAALHAQVDADTSKGSAIAPWEEQLQAVAANSGTTVEEAARALSDVRLSEISPDSVATENGSGWDFLEEQKVSDVVEEHDESGDGGAASYVKLQELSWTLEVPHLLEMVNSVVDTMPERQAKVLVLAYGLKGEPKLTLKGIAERCGLNSHVSVKYHLKKSQQMLADGLLNQHDLELADYRFN